VLPSPPRLVHGMRGCTVHTACVRACVHAARAGPGRACVHTACEHAHGVRGCERAHGVRVCARPACVCTHGRPHASNQRLARCCISAAARGGRRLRRRPPRHLLLQIVGRLAQVARARLFRVTARQRRRRRHSHRHRRHHVGDGSEINDTIGQTRSPASLLAVCCQ
jgi:hypothetical protein